MVRWTALAGALAVVAALGCAGLGKAPEPKVELPPADPTAWQLPELDCGFMTKAESHTDEAGMIEQWCVADGKMEGVYRQFHPGGKKAAEGAYTAGKRSGNWTWWHTNGQQSVKGRYREGKQVGSWAYFHPNGERSEEGDYLDGSRAGKWISYHQNGVTSETGEFLLGVKHGQWDIYNDQGSLVKSEVWEQGRQVK